MADMRMQLVLGLREKVLGPLKSIQAGSQEAAQALKATRDQLRDLEKVQQDVSGLRTTRIQLRGQQRDLQELQGKLGSHNAGLQDQRERHRHITASLKTARESHARLTQSLQDGATTTPQFTRQLELARTALLTSQSAYERSNASISKYRGQIKNTQTDIAQLTGKMSSGQERLQGYERRLQEAGIGTDRLGLKSRSFKTQMEAATAAVEKQKQSLVALKVQQERISALKAQHAKSMMHTGMAVGTGAAMAVTGRAMARPVQATLGAYSNQEDASTQLSASMMQADGSVSKEFKDIDELAKRLGDRLPGTTADFIEMMTMLRRQGLSAKTILGGTGEAAALLGVQLRMPVTAAAEFAAKMQDATRTSEADMLGLMDMIQRTYYLGVDSGNMLQGFTKMSPVLSVIKMQGLDAANALAPLLVMMDQTGMAGESAGNAIRKVFQAGLDTKKLGEANAMLAKAGAGFSLSFTDKDGNFAGMDNLFQQVEKLKAIKSDTSRMAVIKKLFGDDAETLQVLNTLMDKGRAGYDEVASKMAAQANLQKRVDMQLGTLSNVMEAAQGGFTNVMASIGETVQGDAKGIISWIGELTSGLGKWVAEHPVLTAAIVRTVAVLAALTAGLGVLLVPLALIAGKAMLLRFAFGMLGIKLPGIIGALQGLSTIFLRLGMVMLTTPVGWFIMAIAAIAAAVYAIYKNWEPIKQFFSGLWQSIGSAISGAWQAITTRLSSAWTNLLTTASSIWQQLGGLVSAALLTIGAAIVNWSPAALLYQAFAGAMAYLGFDLPARFTEFGANILQGLANGITSRLAVVRDAIGGAADSAVGWFKEKLGIHSPSRVFMAAGVNVGEGAALGVESTQGLLRQSALGLAAAASVALPAMAAMPPLPVGMAAAVQAEPVRVNTSQPITAAPAQRPAPVIQGDTITFQIHAAPGMDEQAIARLVSAELERRDRAKSARAQAAFYD